MPSYRHIRTDSLAEGYDLADLIATGIEDDALLDWCKAHVTPGPVPMPPQKARPATAKPEGSAERGPRQHPTSIGHDDHSNVVAIRKPAPVEDDLGLPPEYSDDCLADAFSSRYHESMVYVSKWNRWMLWENALWKEDDTLTAMDRARIVCRKHADEAFNRPDLKSKSGSIATRLASAGTIANVERIARTDRRHAARTDQWDSDPFALNTPKGIIDLRTGLSRPPRKDDYCTRITNASPRDGCPTWREFLKVATDGDRELEEFMRRVAGYCLTGDITEQKFFFVYGMGANGKSTFINTIQWVLNTYSTSASMKIFTEEKFSTDSSEIAGMQGSRLVTAQETEEGKRWNEQRMKEWTGGERITCRFLYSNPFTYTPQFKLLFAGNHKPALRNVDEAMKRRLLLIPFTVMVPPEKRDPDLMLKLRAEAGGILEWAIGGCIDWQRNTMAPPERVLATTGEYFEGEDTLAQFLDDCCTIGVNEQVKSSSLYRRFGAWAEAAGEFVLPQKRFLQAIQARGFKTVKRSVSVILGVSVKSGDGREYQD